jgi:glycosyltransferase involved in cell wall biosynthesis
MSDRRVPFISIITPCLNSARYLECAIQSVLAQRYDQFEHIVVDGGSTDGSVDVLKRYPHLRWVSEADQGQSDAMNKGFAMARGSAIAYLNADDYFERGAFDAAGSALAAGANFVVGRVRIVRQDDTEVINDPKVSLREMLRWWTADAYCYNSAGYFYRREVQEATGPFNVQDDLTMDFEFLIEAVTRYAFTKIDDVLAVFRHFPGTKTYDRVSSLQWFRRFDHYIALLDPTDRESYMRERTDAFAAES